MQLTNPEKLILFMLSEIHEKLGITNGIDTKLIRSAILNDQTWALSRDVFPIANYEAPHELGIVLDILGMWKIIEQAYERLEESEKTKIEKEAKEYGRDVKFVGFCATNEKRFFSIAKFRINDMEGFPEFKGRNLDSHIGKLQIYQNMLAVFKKLPPTELTVDQLINILKASPNRMND
jgi:uncharacterized protein